MMPPPEQDPSSYTRRPPALPSQAYPWGPWITTAMTMAILTMGFTLQFGVALMYNAVARLCGFAPHIHEPDGLLFAIIACITAPAIIGCTVLCVSCRRGLSTRHYLAVHAPRQGQPGLWVIAILGLSLIGNALAALLGQPIIPEIMIEVYETARFTPLLWLAAIVAIPLYEECLFRGFFFAGLERARIGPRGAIVATALAWAALFQHYDMLVILQVFIAGLLFGAARYKTGSIYIPILLHAVWNMVGLLETAVYLSVVGL